MQAQIASGTIDSPSWDIIRSAKLATKIYAPLGTNMTLGDYVRVSRSFVEVFKWAHFHMQGIPMVTSGSEEEDTSSIKEKCDVVSRLKNDLKVNVIASEV